jgi:hypothetical protein
MPRFSRTHRICLALLAAALIAAPLAAGNNPLQQLGKALQDSSQQAPQDSAAPNLAVAQQALESSAQVSQADDTAKPSVVVETDDGRVFQVKSVVFAPDLRLNAALAQASSVTFTSEGNNSYTAQVEYRPVQSQKKGLFGSIVSAAVNTALQAKASTFHVRLQFATGTALNGQAWALDLRNTTLKKITVLAS